jgi:hypothetical protein
LTDVLEEYIAPSLGLKGKLSKKPTWSRRQAEQLVTVFRDDTILLGRYRFFLEEPSAFIFHAGGWM